MKKYIVPILIAGFSLQFSGCSDFLDKTPDNRTQIDSKKKVQQLLVTAYSTASYGLMGEMSSDNMVDNNSPDDTGNYETKEAASRLDDEAYAWNDIQSTTAQDSPFYLWNNHYHAIATANAALDAIEELEAEGIDMRAEKGEALLCRAYHHFILVNVFGQHYKDENLSASDLGVPYAIESEKIVEGKYERKSVAETYALIQADLEAGLSLVDDSYYSVPKYHFNKKAAYAFATRFYLYKRDWQKVVECANVALANLTQGSLRDAQKIKNSGYPDSEIYVWIDEKQPCNLLIMPVYSNFLRSFWNTRYGFNREAQKGTFKGKGPSWDKDFPAYSFWTYGAKFGGFISKIYELFEYTDKVAGIGYPRMVRQEFTTNETLLCRAEALIYLNRMPEALDDLNLWSKACLCAGEVTDATIRGFYTEENPLMTPQLNADQMSPSFIVSNDILPYIHCVLHFRRIETAHDGMRWFDLKRYGIEIQHKIGLSSVETLKWNDDRRAIQLPQDVIGAGIPANPRNNVSINNPSFGYISGTGSILNPIPKEELSKLVNEFAPKENE